MSSRTKNKSILLFLFFLIAISFIPTLAKAEIITDNINTNKIDEFINLKMKSEKIPGCSLAIVKDNKILYLKGYGKDGKGNPVTPQTPFILGSLSKSFTGLAISQLVDKGKIDLDAPVQKYIPWFSLADSELSKQITINQLLSHTSGISTYHGRTIHSKDNVPIEQLVRDQKSTKLSNPPGKVYEYSNLNYIILGEVVETVSGIPYEQYIEENIFKPLVMKHSYTNQNMAIENGFASGYNSYFGFMFPDKKPNHQASAPSGYLISSSEDMAHYLIAEMNGGSYDGNTVISEEGMNRTHLSTSMYHNYGMGWSINKSGIIYHGGDTENFHTDVRMFKDDGLGIAMLFNSNDYITSTLSKSGVYGDIPNGVNSIIRGTEPVSQRTNDNVSSTRSTINVVGVIIVILLLTAVLRMFKWKNRLKLNRGSIKRHIIVLILVNILIPAAIVAFVPGILASQFKTTIRLFMLAIPDFGMLLILIPIVLFIIGIIKIIILVSYNRNRKNIKEKDMKV